MSTTEITRIENSTAFIVASKAYKHIWNLQKQLSHPFGLGQYLMLRRIANRDDFELAYLYEGESHGYRYKKYDTEHDLLIEGLADFYKLALAIEKGHEPTEMFDPATYRSVVESK